MQSTKVILTNRTARFVRPYDYDCLNEFLKYRKAGWEYTYAGQAYISWKKAVEHGEADEDDPKGWDGYLHLLQKDEVGAGAFLALREAMEREATTRFVVKDQRRPPDFVKDCLGSEGHGEERSYQRECYIKMLGASHTGGLILNATGTGKTYIAGLYLKALKGPALFLVDELTLLDQAQKELTKVIGEPVGNIGNQIFNPKRVTVATIQTIHRHRYDQKFVPWTRTLQCIIIDELHTALNRSNFQTVAVIKPPVVFGLTATLEMKKKSVYLRAYDMCGPVVFEYPLEQGVKEGFLSKGVAISVQVNQDLQGERIRGNPKWRWVRLKYTAQYQELYEKVIVEGRERNRVIREFVKEAHDRGKYVIVLLERVQHLKDMSALLSKIPHNLVFGEKHVSQRIESKAAFEKGNIRVLLANKVFKKGIDIKRVDVIIDGAGMKSRNDCVQKYGRGVRLCKGKDGLIYIDISDTGNRFEKAGKARRTALKKVGVPIYKVSSEKGAGRILDLAEKKLKEIK